MAYSIQQVLGYQYFGGVIEAVKSGIPNVLPDKFWSIKTSVPKDMVRYTRYSGTRKVPRRVEYGAPSLKRELNPIGTFDVKLLHTFEHIDLTVTDYMQLRGQEGPAMAERGRQEVDRQAALFRQLLDNYRVALVSSMLANTAIYFDADGNLLPSSSGATLTVDFGVNANNKNQLNGIITASWATATTNIPLQITNLMQRAARLTGFPVKYAGYGTNIPTYLTQNNFVKEFFYRNASLNERYVGTGVLPSGLLGLEWFPLHPGFFEDSTGTLQDFFSGDTVVFFPELDSNLYELVEGTYPVPTTFQPMASLQASMDSFDFKTGMFGYGLPIQEPMTARLYSGDTVMPLWKVPDAIFVADVTP